MLRLSLLFVCAALASPVHLTAAEPGKVDGKLVVEGKTTKFDHVYAISVPADGGERLFRVIFANAAISDADLALFPDPLLERMNAGKLTAIRLNFAKGGSDPSVEVYEASVGTSSIPDGNQLALTTSTEKLVAGRLHRDKPYSDAGGTYDYDLKFSAPVREDTELKP